MKNYQNKIIVSELSIIKDRKGRYFVACIVKKGQIIKYINYLRTVVSLNEWVELNLRRHLRDGSNYHITIFTPYEKFKEILHGRKIIFKLYGVGSVCEGKDKSFYIIAKSLDAFYLRRKLKYKMKDFHVTLGFIGRDIHSVRKDFSTLI